MPSPPIRFANWPQGANNASQENRLPEGAARALLNLDPTKGGTLEMRPQFSQRLAVADLRAAFGLGQQILFVDGELAKVFSPRDGSVRVLGNVPTSGHVAGAELNGKLYLSVLGNGFVYDGHSLKTWGAQPPVIRVSLARGSMPAGVYKLAATALDGEGFESGATVVIITAAEGSSFQVTTADERQLRLYASPCDGQTLYDQGVFAGSTQVSHVGGESRDLETANMVPLPDVSMLAVSSSMLFGARGPYLFRTEPMMPHLHDRVRGFYQFPADITLLASVSGGLYIAADRTYFLSAPASSEEQLPAVFDFGAISGSFTRLPDGRATWFCEYGQAIGNSVGEVQLLNQDKFLPDTAPASAAGILNHNGLQTAITSMRGGIRRSGVAVRDSWVLEVL